MLMKNLLAILIMLTITFTPTISMGSRAGTRAPSDESRGSSSPIDFFTDSIIPSEDPVTVRMVTWIDNPPYYIKNLQVPLEKRGMVGHLLKTGILNVCPNANMLTIIDDPNYHYRSHKDIVDLIKNDNITDIQARLNITSSSKTVVVVSATTFSTKDNNTINPAFTVVRLTKSKTLAVLVRSEDILLLKKVAKGLVDCFEIIFFGSLMAINLGAVVWLIEHKFANNPEFPDTVGSGIWSGIWYCFVTMTTVGYGDKVPKHFFTQMICVVWMLFGLLVTAILTSSIISAVDSEVPKAGKEMAVIRDSFERTLLQNQFPSAIAKSYDSYIDIIDALQEKQVSAALVEMNVAAYYLNTTGMDNIKIEKEISGDVDVWMFVYATDSAEETCFHSGGSSNNIDWIARYSVGTSEKEEKLRALFVPSHQVTPYMVRPLKEIFNNDDKGVVLYATVLAGTVIVIAVASAVLSKIANSRQLKKFNNSKADLSVASRVLTSMTQESTTEAKLEMIIRRLLREQGCTCVLKHQKERGNSDERR